MSKENMDKFFSECKNNFKLQKELHSLKKESENLDGLNIINFLNKKLMPFIKNHGYDISLADFLNYPYELSADDLSNVSGGFNPHTGVALSLALISMIGSISLGTHCFTRNNNNDDSLTTSTEQNTTGDNSSPSAQDENTLGKEVKNRVSNFFDTTERIATNSQKAENNATSSQKEESSNHETKIAQTREEEISNNESEISQASKPVNSIADSQYSALKEENSNHETSQANKSGNSTADYQDSALKEENENLKAEIARLKQQNLNLKVENESLKSQLSNRSSENSTAFSNATQKNNTNGVISRASSASSLRNNLTPLPIISSISSQNNTPSSPPPPPPHIGISSQFSSPTTPLPPPPPASSSISSPTTPLPPPPSINSFQNISSPPPAAILEKRIDLSEKEQEQLLENIKQNNEKNEQAQIQADKMKIEAQKKAEANKTLSPILPIFQLAQGDESFFKLPETASQNELNNAAIKLSAASKSHFTTKNVVETLQQVQMKPSAINPKYSDLDDLWEKSNNDTMSEDDNANIEKKCKDAKDKIAEVLKNQTSQKSEKQEQKSAKKHVSFAQSDIEYISEKVNSIKRHSNAERQKLENDTSSTTEKLKAQQNKINAMLSTRPENVDFENYQKQVINDYNKATKKLNEIQDKIAELTSQSKFSKAKFDKLQDLGNKALKLIEQLKNIQTAMEGNISDEQKTALTRLELKINNALKTDTFDDIYNLTRTSTELEKKINDYEKATLRYDELRNKEGKTIDEQNEFNTLENDIINGKSATYKGVLYNNNNEKVNIANMKKQLEENNSKIQEYNKTLSKLSTEAQKLLEQIK